jgi:hypothetical protein
MANASGGAYAPMSGNGSMVTNGQIVGVPMLGQFFPSMASAPFYSGNGQGPPTIPVNYIGNRSGISSAPLSAMSPTQGPVWITIAAIVIGILGLRYIHWRS